MDLIKAKMTVLWQAETPFSVRHHRWHLSAICEAISLSLSIHWSHYVSHHQRVLIKRVKERVPQWGKIPNKHSAGEGRRQRWGASGEGGHSSPCEAQMGDGIPPCWLFVTFFVCSPCAWGARLGRICVCVCGSLCMCACVCVCIYVWGCVKRMWRRTQRGLLIIQFTIQSLSEPPGSTMPPTHGRPFNNCLKHIN